MNQQNFRGGVWVRTTSDVHGERNYHTKNAARQDQYLPGTGTTAEALSNPDAGPLPFTDMAKSKPMFLKNDTDSIASLRKAGAKKMAPHNFFFVYLFVILIRDIRASALTVPDIRSLFTDLFDITLDTAYADFKSGCKIGRSTRAF